ncbi:ATP-grasp domain-containing protein [Bacillus sp. Marseille-P3661]|uniref:ATP-grasp domain-containing protein n=1 Tax=Bacillus sp. Marseille-P3661 TaxID=1936234 RepID=UPI000C82C971|nr:hypothetical protein [Bacillus sp. Marseille-P3661]
MKKTGWLIYYKNDAKRNHAFIDWMITEADSLGVTLKLLLREDLVIGIRANQPIIYYHGKTIDHPEFAIVRAINPRLNKQLEQLGIAVFNNSVVAEICNNKAKTHQYFLEYSIPMVDTLFFEPGAFELSKVPFEFPYILKEVKGRGGQQVYWINNAADLQPHNFLIQHHEIIIQKPAPVLGKDLRVFVIGSEIVGAVLRHSETHFKANFTLGGDATLYSLSNEEMVLVQTIISKLDFGFVGIDFLFDQDGKLLLNEIEDVVGSRTLSHVSSINVVRLYLEFILKNI